MKQPFYQLIRTELEQKLVAMFLVFNFKFCSSKNVGLLFRWERVGARAIGTA
jgi:hypothetical protein